MSRRLSAILALDVVGYTARMASDPSSMLADLDRVLKDVVGPCVKENEGRLFKLMGDGALAEFKSARGAIIAAEKIQSALKDDEVKLRAGVSVGDVSITGNDLFGDAVNIAARLQASAPSGGALISRTAVDVAGGGLGIALKAEGAMRLKGIPQPVEAMSLDLGSVLQEVDVARLAASQDIRFATSADGTRIAWTAAGDGPLLVKAPNWVQHLEQDWSVALCGWLPQLSTTNRLVRFDARCNGLSDRNVPDLALERFVDDLEAVFDAAEIERAPVFGHSLGCAVAVAFAARRPERVSGLVLISGFVQGLRRRKVAGDAELLDAMTVMGRANWDSDYPTVRDLHAQRFTPDASPGDHHAYAAFMRVAIDRNDHERIGETIGDMDITAFLPKVSCPALVMHANRERIHGTDQGRQLAAGIPNARFVGLDTANNLMPVYDPSWPAARREIDAFLAAI